MEIPVDQLSPEALKGIVEEFITREGTDYGQVEVSLHDKIAQVMAQIAAGEVVVRFDASNQTCGLFVKE